MLRLDDPTDDADVADIARVVIERNSDALTLSMRLTRPLPASGTAAILVHVTDVESTTDYEAWLEYRNRKQVSSYVTDVESDGKSFIEEDAYRVGRDVRVSFPVAYFRRLGDVWMLNVTTSVDGEDQDVVPDTEIAEPFSNLATLG